MRQFFEDTTSLSLFTPKILVIKAENKSVAAVLSAQFAALKPVMATITPPSRKEVTASPSRLSLYRALRMFRECTRASEEPSFASLSSLAMVVRRVPSPSSPTTTAWTMKGTPALLLVAQRLFLFPGSSISLRRSSSKVVGKEWSSGADDRQSEATREQKATYACSNAPLCFVSSRREMRNSEIS